MARPDPKAMTRKVIGKLIDKKAVVLIKLGDSIGNGTAVQNAVPFRTPGDEGVSGGVGYDRNRLFRSQLQNRNIGMDRRIDQWIRLPGKGNPASIRAPVKACYGEIALCKPAGFG